MAKSWMSRYPLILHQEEVVAYLHGPCWNHTRLHAGDYLLVMLNIDDVGGGFIGIESLSSRILHLDNEIYLPINALSSPDNSNPLVLMSGSDITLSSSQSKSVLEHLKSLGPDYSHWLDNATQEVKRLLFEDHLESNKEKGLRLLREAGTLLQKKEHLQKAYELTQEAIQLNPGLMGHGRYFMLGEITIEFGNIGDAIQYFEKETQHNPDSCEAHIYLCAIYEQLGQFPEQKRHYLAASESPLWKRHGGISLSEEALAQIRTVVQRGESK